MIFFGPSPNPVSPQQRDNTAAPNTEEFTENRAELGKEQKTSSPRQIKDTKKDCTPATEPPESKKFRRDIPSQRQILKEKGASAPHATKPQAEKPEKRAEKRGPRKKGGRAVLSNLKKSDLDEVSGGGLHIFFIRVLDLIIIYFFYFLNYNLFNSASATNKSLGSSISTDQR
jgi:hypothetical protein